MAKKNKSIYIGGNSRNFSLSCGKRFLEGKPVKLVRKPGGAIVCPEGRCPNCNIVSQKWIKKWDKKHAAGVLFSL